MGRRGKEAALGTLGLGDLMVSRLGFGAMRITGRDIWGPPPERAAAIRLLRRVVELGITLIDTLIPMVPASARS
jgi:aryl-alcohol dehydrogenase-like predicted oxidoreductase